MISMRLKPTGDRLANGFELAEVFETGPDGVEHPVGYVVVDPSGEAVTRRFTSKADALAELATFEDDEPDNTPKPSAPTMGW